MAAEPLDLARLKVYPLAERKSLTRVTDILVDPQSVPGPCPAAVLKVIDDCVLKIRAARARGAAVILIYGAHLLRNGAALVLERMMAGDFLTHLATNGAGTIHDWEYAWQGASTESVEQNVATGSFGTWDETSTNIHLALLAGALEGLGYGRSMGRLILEDGATIPSLDTLISAIVSEPESPLTGPRSDFLRAIRQRSWPAGRLAINHCWKESSILAQAYRHGIPVSVHPGIGYDIIANHPIFNGAVIGRAAELDFKLIGGSLQSLEGGVVLSIGSAIMGPQVFEKALSCVNNLRIQEGKDVVKGHTFYVVDLQDGGNWDWTAGEPPKSNPAYYLRFCKSYSRMGGTLNYSQCDNMTFLHHLHKRLSDS